MASFSKAKYRTEIKGFNNVPLGMADNEVKQAQKTHGICCGISATWVVGFLGGHKGATGGKRLFGSYFFNVLRFQGTYIKHVQKSGKENIDRLVSQAKLQGVTFSKEISLIILNDNTLSTDYTWAAYISLFGQHAIGIGYEKKQNLFYLMNPNSGLFSYDKFLDFKSDYNQYIDKRWRKITDIDKAAKWGARGWIYK